MAREHVGKTLNGGQLLIGVEDVEFRFVGREGIAGILLHVVFAVLSGGIEPVGDLRSGAGRICGHGFFERRPIVGEIGQHR